jgi:hypothetical protein
MFIFDGGTLTDQQVADLKVHDGELRDCEFCTSETAAARLRPAMRRRLAEALLG